MVPAINDLIISRSDVERAEQALVEEDLQANATPRPRRSGGQKNHRRAT